MRRTPLLAAAMLATPLVGGSQTVTWNDKATVSWLEEAPRVRIAIDGPRSLRQGAPVLVRFEVSDNAYVAVVRVAGDGKMTILYPYSQRRTATVQPGRTYYAANPRYGGNISFVTNDPRSGYVFAIASYAPIDLSQFESRDFERFGAYSPFTLANRTFAPRPDVFIDRFAASVLWDHDTPYDYDVDYYFPIVAPTTMTYASSLCSGRFHNMSSLTYRSLNYYDLDDWDLVAYPYREMCRDYYTGLRCAAYAPFLGYSGCIPAGRTGSVLYTPVATVPKESAPVAAVPNESVIRNGLFGPNPVPIPVSSGDDPPPVERVLTLDQLFATADEDWDQFRAIPARAARKLKEADASATKPSRDNRSASTTSALRLGSPDDRDRLVAGAAGSDGAVQPPPPSREPRKVKGATTDQRRPSPSSRTGSTLDGRNTDPGTIGTGRMRPITRPDVRPAPRPATITGSGTTKTKPPETKPPLD